MELQPVSIPLVDHTLMSNNIEIIFECIDPDGTRFLEWYEVNVISVPKAEGGENNTVTVFWNQNRLKFRDNETLNVILMP